MTNVDPVGTPDEQGVGGGPVLVLADFDRIGGMVPDLADMYVEIEHDALLIAMASARDRY